MNLGERERGEEQEMQVFRRNPMKVAFEVREDRR